MKRAFFMLACSVVLGIYFIGEYPSFKKPARNTQAVTVADDIKPLLPLAVTAPIRPPDLLEKAVARNEEQALKTVSLGEYIDPSNLARSTYREPIEVGEYIDPREPLSDLYDSLSVGEYMPVDEESRGYDSAEVSLGEYAPINSGSVSTSDRGPVTTGEYIPLD